jgi:hypothetical protein
MNLLNQSSKLIRLGVTNEIENWFGGDTASMHRVNVQEKKFFFLLFPIIVIFFLNFE